VTVITTYVLYNWSTFGWNVRVKCSDTNNNSITHKNRCTCICCCYTGSKRM